VQCYFEYPNRGDQREVRPSIRATEIGIDQNSSSEVKEARLKWNQAFWQEAFNTTKCIHPPLGTKQINLPEISTSTNQVNLVYEKLIEHFFSVLNDSSLNPKQDAVFGISLYAIGVLQELLSIKITQGILGRSGLRTLAELHINLAYLVAEDKEELWKAYRNYGHGQAKLSFLKLIELTDKELPSFVNLENLHYLANEDVWQEFVDINVGAWDSTDLRKRAEKSRTKHIYDKFYDWTSGYVHCHWGAVRDSVLTTCLNPLHRYHRIPLEIPRLQNDVIPDACKLVDQTLDILDSVYPNFDIRVSV
jgi:hypothetical protein